MFANGSRRVQRGVAKCKAPRGEASRLVPVLVPRRCDDHFIPFIPSSIITRSNAAQALEYITLPAGLRGVPYNLLVEAAILKQVFTSCFGLHKSTCNSTQHEHIYRARRVLDKNIRLRIQKRPPFLPNKI